MSRTDPDIGAKNEVLMNMKRIFAILLSLMMAFGMTACADGSRPNAPIRGSVPVQESVPAQLGDAAENSALHYYLQKANEVTVTDTGVTFTDDTGRGEQTIEKGPKNVAVLYGSLACLWYEAGGTVQIAIGGESAATLYKEQIGRDITRDEGVTVAAEVFLGTNWDVESILAARPDLIICSTGMKGYETIGGPADALGIPVIGINYDGVQDYLKWFKVFCSLTGHPELWDTVADATVRKIGGIVSSVSTDEEPLTSVSIFTHAGGIKAYTIASQTGVIIHELGGANLVDPDNSGTSASLEISLEDLYALDPDVIFLTVRSDLESARADMEQTVGGSPVWNELRAVKEGRVYFLEKGLFFNKANHRYDEAYLTMAQYLYPNHEF